MKLAVAAAAFFSMGALATPVAPPSEFHLTDLEWTVEVSPGHSITVNGTIEDVALAFEHEQFEGKGLGNSATDGQGDSEGVEKRATDFLAPGGSYYCWGPLKGAHMVPLNIGLEYLRGIGKGAVKMSGGPGACGRVSCSMNGAVFLCNDNRETFYLDSWDRVADGLSFIMGRCGRGFGGGRYIAGQVFHPDNWNVLVRGDSC